MQLLVCLARANGEVVSRDELMERIWPRLVVGDVLNNTVANLRKALGDSRPPRRYIETISKQGYRLIPAVHWETETVEETDSGAQEIKSDKIFYQQRPSERKAFFARHKLSLLFIIPLMIVVGTYFQFEQSSSANPDPDLSGKLNTLAVLPFETFSDQRELKFFADGLVEELIHQLAANPDIRVIARTSTEAFRNTNTGIPEISRILGARYIMEGSIRQSDEILRVTVQLIDAQNSFHLWSRTFDHQRDDNVLDTQIAIGEKVAVLISADERSVKVYQNRKHPESAEAYKLFLIAQAHLKFTAVNHLEKALDYYQRAIDIAPDYALAYTGVAAAQLLLYQYKHTSLSEAVRLSSVALNKAFSIESDLAEAFAVRGLQETYSGHFSAAENDFEKALELNPGMRFARHNYGFMLWRLSRPKEALVQFEIALKMDPLSSITNFAVGDVLGNLGEFDQAIAHYLQCQELLPENFSCFLGLANIYQLAGDYNESSHYLSLAAQRIEADNFWLTTSKAMNALVKGEITESNALLMKATLKNPNNDYLLRTSFLVNLKSSSLDLFSQKIRQLIIENPQDFELNLLLGLVSYFESNCSLAVTQYEQVNNEYGSTLLEIWDFAQGISHTLNLAYCYQEKKHVREARELLEQFHQFIQNLPATPYVVPGRVYNEARYLMLTGKQDEAKALLQEIQDWPFIWLSDYEPIWQ